MDKFFDFLHSDTGKYIVNAIVAFLAVKFRQFYAPSAATPKEGGE